MVRLRGIQFESSEDVEPICSEVTRGKEILYLTRDEIEGMGYIQKEIIELTRIALTEHGKKQVDMPAKIGIHPIKNTFHHAMPAFVPAAGALGIKWGGASRRTTSMALRRLPRSLFLTIFRLVGHWL